MTEQTFSGGDQRSPKVPQPNHPLELAGALATLRDAAARKAWVTLKGAQPEALLAEIDRLKDLCDEYGIGLAETNLRWERQRKILMVVCDQCDHAYVRPLDDDITDHWVHKAGTVPGSPGKLLFHAMREAEFVEVLATDDPPGSSPKTEPAKERP